MNGVWVPLITPFAEDGTVALGVLEDLARETLAAGAAGLVALGTTGEPAALSAAERSAVLETLARTGAPLLVGANSPAQLADLPAGTTAALTLVPPFLRPGEDGAVAWFEALARTAPVPLIAYHVPYRTAQPLSAPAVHRLAAVEGVIGMKYAPGALDAEAVTLLTEPPADFHLFCGDDVLLAPMLALGASGGILASAHLNTGVYVDLVTAWQAGDTARARPLGRHLARLSAALFAHPNPTVIKAVLHAAGRIPTPDVRLPLLPAPASAVDAVAPYLYGSLVE